MSACLPAVIAVVATTPVPVQARTLGEALQAAMAYSPAVVIARSRVQGSQAELTVARADGLPSVDATLQYNRDIDATGRDDDGVRAETSVNIPLFRGGSVRNGVMASKARLGAARTQVHEAEGEVTLAVTRAYADVLRDRKIVALNRENVANLEKMLGGVRQRLEARDLTRTDVDQADSRLQLARGRLEVALANLEASEVGFQRLTGARPGELAAFPVIGGLPHDVEDALTIALDNNPALLAARVEAQASRYDLQSARGNLMPQVYATVNNAYAAVPVQGGADYRNALDTRVGISLRMGLFQGGGRSARVTMAAASSTQAEQRVLDLERSITATTRAIFAEWSAARALVEASRNAVQANQKALSGVRLENAVGTRTILDILNAEQELRDAQEQLAAAEHNASVSAMAILVSMGLGRPQYLSLREVPVEGAPVDPGAGGIQTGDAADREQSAGQRQQPVKAAGTAAAPVVSAPFASAPVAASQSAPSVTAAAARSGQTALPTPPVPGPAAAPQSGEERPGVQARAAVVAAAPAAQRPAVMPALASPESFRTGQSGWIVQAGAFDSLALATRHWRRLSAGSLVGAPGLTPVVYRAAVSGKVWFRLAIGGFADWQAAQQACLHLKRSGQTCLVRRSAGLGDEFWRGR